MPARTRRLLAGTACAAVGWCSLPAARASGAIAPQHRISETLKVVLVETKGKPGTPSYRAISAATLDGTIDGRPIRGARRIIAAFPSPGNETLHGTEFDARGSRSFVIHNHYTILSGARVSDKGTGRWTGGTDAYARARGTFTISGVGKIGGVSTIQLTGRIAY